MKGFLRYSAMLVLSAAILPAAVPAFAQEVGSYTVTYTYDEQRRLTSAVFDEGTTIDYVFDVAGNMTSAIVAANQAPGAFVRLMPPDSSLVAADSVRLAWSASADPDADAVSYTVRITSGATDTTLVTSDTTIVASLARDLLTPRDVTWRVTASDGRFETPAANGDGYFLLGARSGVATDPMAELPTEVALDQNYPNPFNPVTTITYGLPAPTHVDLSIYDALGRRVAVLVHADLPAGRHRATWNARLSTGLDAPTGLYLYRLTAGPTTRTRTMLLVR